MTRPPPNSPLFPSPPLFRSQYPADNAILICVSLTPSAVGQWRARYDGREVGVTRAIPFATTYIGSEEHTSELQSLRHLVCRLLLEKKKTTKVEVNVTLCSVV